MCPSTVTLQKSTLKVAVRDRASTQAIWAVLMRLESVSILPETHEIRVHTRLWQQLHPAIQEALRSEQLMKKTERM